jgi:hypothetical protein
MQLIQKRSHYGRVGRKQLHCAKRRSIPQSTPTEEALAIAGAYMGETPRATRVIKPQSPQTFLYAASLREYPHWNPYAVLAFPLHALQIMLEAAFGWPLT